MFTRTTCDCERCQIGCRTMPGSLLPGDAERIAEQLGERYDKEFLGRYFQASDGPIAMSQGRAFRIPTLVPKLTPTGCVFLREGRCTIHAVAPFGCSHFDTHMDDREANQRSHWQMTQVMAAHQHGNHPYSNAIQYLACVDQIAPPLLERKAAFAQAEAALAGVVR